MKLKLCLVLSIAVSTFCYDVEKSINENVQNKIEISNQIEKTKLQMLATVNTILNMRNWHLGKLISNNQSNHKWGSCFIDNLSNNLKNIYPDDSGLSRTSLYRLLAFYEAYKVFDNDNKVEKLSIFMIPWGHNITLLDKVKNIDERLWYAKKSLELNLSRSELEESIKNDLYKKENVLEVKN